MNNTSDYTLETLKARIANNIDDSYTEDYARFVEKESRERELLGKFYDEGYRIVDPFGTIGLVINGNVSDLRYPCFDCRGRKEYRRCEWVNGHVRFLD